MPEKRTIRRARKDARQGKAPGTQAGEFVREEMEHIRKGKHGARSSKQAIAIGLSKARRAGVKLAAPKKGRAPAAARKKAQQDLKRGRARRTATHRPSRRSTARRNALKKEPRRAASHRALSQQAKSAARARRRHGTVTRARKARPRK